MDKETMDVLSDIENKVAINKQSIVRLTELVTLLNESIEHLRTELVRPMDQTDKD